MGSGIAPDNAAIMLTVLESILYGFSLLMFIGTIWVLTQRKDRHKSNLGMISIAAVLLTLSTTHMVVNIVRLDEGLVKYPSIFHDDPSAFFKDVSQKIFVIKNAIYTLQTLLGDGVVIYRCYVVWQSIQIIIIPSVLWCSVAVTAVGSVYSASQATANAMNIYAKGTGQWLTGFFALTLITNLLSSGLLAYRIWTIERNVATIRVSNKSTLMPALRVLVDAAALYSATLFTALLCFINANNGQYIVADMVIPIISITFYMVLIRISVRRKTMPHVSTTQSGVPTDVNSPRETAYGMRPLQVHISQFSRCESDPPYQLGNQEVERENLYATHKVASDGVDKLGV